MPHLPDRDRLQRERDLARDQANKGGPASAHCHVVTRGAGTFVFTDRIDFGCTFIEEPFPAFASKVDLDDAEDKWGLDANNQPPLPQCTGYVHEWDLDEKGNWVGAFVTVRVTDPDAAPLTGDNLAIRHYFTFFAVAIKDLPDNTEDQASE
jgi:hypothetical protein